MDDREGGGREGRPKERAQAPLKKKGYRYPTTPTQGGYPFSFGRQAAQGQSGGQASNGGPAQNAPPPQVAPVRPPRGGARGELIP